MEKMKNLKSRTAAAASSSGTSSRLHGGQYFSEDLTIDIQRRLSLSCLRRLCCVSRSWNFLLSDPKFVYESIFDGRNEEADTQLLITICDKPIYSIGAEYVYSCLHYDSLLPIDNPDQDDDDDEGATFRKFPGKQPVMIGCEGGLILLKYRRDQFDKYFGLFNPATGEAKMLPPLPQDLHSNNDDYFVSQSITSALTLVEKEDDQEEEEDQYYYCKVVSVHHYFTHTNYATHNFLYNKAFVFGSDESLVWRELLPLDDSSSILSQHLQLYKQVPYYGCMRKKKCYWIAEDHLRSKERFPDSTMVLVSFDPSTEVFEQVGEPLPFPYRKNNDVTSVFMVNEETLVTFNCENELWVLQQLGVEESWCKLFTIKLSSHTSKPIEPIGLSKYGKIICRNGKDTLQVLDVTSGQIHALPFK